LLVRSIASCEIGVFFLVYNGGAGKKLHSPIMVITEFDTEEIMNKWA
jgi:hypothetical protein